MSVDTGRLFVRPGIQEDYGTWQRRCLIQVPIRELPSSGALLTGAGSVCGAIRKDNAGRRSHRSNSARPRATDGGNEIAHGSKAAEKEPSLAAYYKRRGELNFEDGVVIWVNRLVMPKVLQKRVLTILHGDHAGVERMKAVARSFVWWPNMENQLAEMASSCLPCLHHRNSPTAKKEVLWPTPKRPWSRLHADYAGPLSNGSYLFVLMDAMSKWPEITVLSQITSSNTIKILTDNDPQFTSEEFKRFMLLNGIVHHMGAPYHPHGLAERAVQSMKKALSKMIEQPGTLEEKLQSFLVSYEGLPSACLYIRKWTRLLLPSLYIKSSTYATMLLK